MLPTSKLTKRQKKGLAFRERKHRKSKDGALELPSTLEDDADVPSLEDQAIFVDTQGQQGSQASEEAFVWRGKSTEREDAEGQVVVAKKRKKAGEETKESKSDETKAKRRRGSGGRPLEDMEESVEDQRVSRGMREESEKTKQRFILFLGNLKYTTTLEAIQTHFSICVPPPVVRLLTPRPSTKSSTRTVTKSKGCAFLEFKHHGVLQQGLRLHHSELDGRRINVELTAGGGGKGLVRTTKLKERNKELEGQRRKLHSAKLDTQSAGTQRFSATSGTEETHVRERTWTVGNVEESETHRGGQKHRKGSKRQRSSAKEFGTGVNAIPVG